MIDKWSCCFFFQAEDGIRDLVRSRGLGDVYKRQAIAPSLSRGIERLEARFGTQEMYDKAKPIVAGLPVSYTHLTLPTSDLV